MKQRPGEIDQSLTRGAISKQSSAVSHEATWPLASCDLEEGASPGADKRPLVTVQVGNRILNVSITRNNVKPNVLRHLPCIYIVIPILPLFYSFLLPPHHTAYLCYNELDLERTRTNNSKTSLLKR